MTYKTKKPTDQAGLMHYTNQTDSILQPCSQLAETEKELFNANRAYTGGSKSRSSSLLLNRRFFTPQLRTIAKAVGQAVTGVWVFVRTQPSTAVRDPHLNRWTYQSKTVGANHGR